MIKAIVFDLWFTLIPASIDFGKLAKIINHTAYPVDEFIKKYEAAVMTKNYKNFEDLHRDFIKAFPHQNPKISEAELMEVFYNRLQKINFYPDVLPVLAKLKGVYKLGLLSNSESIMVTRVTNELRPEKYFSAIGWSSDLHAIKPAQKTFKYILKKLKVKPSEALMVGDSLHSDIIGAAQAGMHHCLINRWGHPFGTSSVPPEFEIKSLNELPSVLSVLNLKKSLQRNSVSKSQPAKK